MRWLYILYFIKRIEVEVKSAVMASLSRVSNLNANCWLLKHNSVKDKQIYLSILSRSQQPGAKKVMGERRNTDSHRNRVSSLTYASHGVIPNISVEHEQGGQAAVEVQENGSRSGRTGLQEDLDTEGGWSSGSEGKVDSGGGEKAGQQLNLKTRNRYTLGFLWTNHMLAAPAAKGLGPCDPEKQRGWSWPKSDVWQTTVTITFHWVRSLNCRPCKHMAFCVSNETLSPVLTLPSAVRATVVSRMWHHVKTTYRSLLLSSCKTHKRMFVMSVFKVRSIHQKENNLSFHPQQWKIHSLYSLQILLSLPTVGQVLI